MIFLVEGVLVPWRAFSIPVLTLRFNFFVSLLFLFWFVYNSRVKNGANYILVVPEYRILGNRIHVAVMHKLFFG